MTTNTQFQIDRDIAHPGALKSMFPFADMKPGDSFVIPHNKRRMIYQAIHAFKYSDPLRTIHRMRIQGRTDLIKLNWKFSVRYVDDYELRCFRME
jgi:hypothetical protein